MSDDYIYEPSLESHGIDFTPMGISSMRDGIGMVRLGADEQLNIMFEAVEVLIPAKSQNGVAHYETQDYIKILKPSDKTFDIHRRVRESDKSRFAREWLAYKAGKDQRHGLPIKSLYDANLITESQLRMLSEMGVNSVEKCVAASPHVVEAWGAEGAKIQKLAEGYLTYKRQVSGSGDIGKLKADLEAKSVEIQKKSDELEAKLALMDKKLAELEEAKSTKSKKSGKSDLSNTESVISE